MSTQTQNEYLLLFRGDAWYNQVSADELLKAKSQFNAWFDKLAEKGVLKGGQPLVRDGASIGKNGRVVADGPYAESKEAIGGYVLMTANSLEEAIEIAKGSPMLAYGNATIDVRPVAEECMMETRVKAIQAERELAHAAA